MSLRISTLERGDVTIMDLRGRIVLGDGCLEGPRRRQRASSRGPEEAHHQSGQSLTPLTVLASAHSSRASLAPKRNRRESDS